MHEIVNCKPNKNEIAMPMVLAQITFRPKPQPVTALLFRIPKDNEFGNSRKRNQKAPQRAAHFNIQPLPSVFRLTRVLCISQILNFAARNTRIPSTSARAGTIPGG